MATIDVQQALRAISQKKIDPLYVLVGAERYFSSRCLTLLRAQVVEDSLREFNEDIFYGSELDTEKLINAIQTMPVMAERRLVLLKEAHFLSEKDWSRLEEIKEISAETVFVIQADQLDRRKKSVKRWFDRGTLIECQTPKDTERGGWIKMLAREKGLELENDALAYLVQMGGNTLEELDQELERVFLFFGAPRRVSIGELAQILQRSREESIFSLAEALGRKDRPQSLFLLRQLLSQGENEVALVALLARHFRVLLKVKQALHAGLKGAGLAQRVGVNSYFISNYLQQAHVWSMRDLSGVLLSLAEIDRLMKSSSIAPDLWLEHLLFWPTATL